MIPSSTRESWCRYCVQNSHVECDPYNPVPGLPYETPSPDVIHQFRKTLMDGGVNVMFRQRKGDEIQAACGQLRRLREKEPQLVQLQS